MPKAPVLGAKKTVTLDESAFGASFHNQLVHDSVRAELNARRRGTASSKTRAEVRGGGAKPWRQKGTGRARAGSSRSPIWTGGGVIFGPQPRSFTFKVNRKEKRAALRSALSVHADRGSVAILDPAPFADAPSTKQAAALLAGWGEGGAVLIVLTAEQEAVARSFRNLKRVTVLPSLGVGVADVLRYSRLLITEDAAAELTGRVNGERDETEQED